MHKTLLNFFFPKIIVGVIFGFALLGITLGTLKIKEDRLAAFTPTPIPLATPPPEEDQPKPTPQLAMNKESFKEEVLSAQTENLLPKSLKKKEIIGFLPFWLVKEAKIDFTKITTLVYFGISLDKNGKIVRLMDDSTEEPGWTKFNSDELSTIITTSNEKNIHTELAVRAMENEVITAIVNNPKSRQNVIDNALEEMKSKKIQGINVDFEYQGVPDAHTIENFNVFLEEFGKAVHSVNPRYTLSVDTYADTVKKVRLWDLKKIPSDVDKVIIMAYDYTRQSSVRAGPVAPLEGSPDKYEYDVAQTVKDYLSLIPKEKIILGVPFYGYDWPTFDNTPMAEARKDTNNYDPAALSSYKRSMELVREKNLKVEWDDDAQTPWFAYKDNEKSTWREVYFENEKSLVKKLELLIKNDLSGIGIWALGYDGNDPILINTIFQSLNP